MHSKNLVKSAQDHENLVLGKKSSKPPSQPDYQTWLVFRPEYCRVKFDLIFNHKIVQHFSGHIF